MASTSVSNPSCIVEVGEEYPYGPSNNFPYPSHNFANLNIVTVKLSGRDVYNVWEEHMLCLLASHDMLGFIDGQFPSPSDGNGKAKEEDMKAWIISDSLVKRWILGSLSEKVAILVVNRLASEHKIISTNTFYNKKPYFSAKDAWDELKLIYGPSVPQKTEGVSETEEEGEIYEYHPRHDILYQFILQGKTEKVDDIFSKLELTPMHIITTNGDTSLHVAVGSSTKNQELLEKLLKKIPEKSKLLNVQNGYGSTPLHIAAIVGNTEAADVLVQRFPEMLFIKDKKGQTPLEISVYNMHFKTSEHLLDHIEESEGRHTMFSGTSHGDEILILTIISKKFSLSLRLMELYETMLADSEAVLMALAQSFPCELSFWGRIDQGICYHAWELKHLRLIRSCGPSGAVIWKFIIFVWPSLKVRLETYKAAVDLLWEIFDNIEKNTSYLSLYQCYTNMLFEATRLNAFELVGVIVSDHPNTMWYINEDGLNFIQYAVINRSEKIYSLLYKTIISGQLTIFKTIKDPYGNNLLHLAGRLAPANKLKLISGEALQLQRDLQWFKEVEEFVCPLARIQKNYDDETPEMVFTREHMDLVIKGEIWMKKTAESYTITAALIITIVFAAAITVPGGNNQDTGIPIHDNNIAFKIFAVSDAISLFMAVTSLLMFLSILTTRFSEGDFLYKLPTKLIIGLAALFISTTAMIIAFGATLFLVFGHDNSWILVPIGVLTCLPIASFVTLQFPLIADLMGATYGSIFDKRKLY